MMPCLELSRWLGKLTENKDSGEGISLLKGPAIRIIGEKILQTVFNHDPEFLLQQEKDGHWPMVAAMDAMS